MREEGLQIELKKYIDDLLERYPKLKECENDITSAYLLLEECFLYRHKMLVAGNGGSAADCEHIAGELMKGFLLPRNLPKHILNRLVEIDSVKGKKLGENLEEGLMTIPLVGLESLSTAYLNDVDGMLIFAQQLYTLGNVGDVFLAISTSGNSQNIIYSAITAKAIGMKVIGLTGESGGELANYSDVVVRVPEKETFKVQELHMPIYHCICMMLEQKFFGVN